jgi:hypothetical protein
MKMSIMPKVLHFYFTKTKVYLVQTRVQNLNQIGCYKGYMLLSYNTIFNSPVLQPN